MIRTMKNAFISGTLAVATLGLPVGCGGRSSSQELPMPPKASAEDVDMCRQLTASCLHLIGSARLKTLPSQLALASKRFIQDSAEDIGEIKSAYNEKTNTFEVTFIGYGLKSKDGDHPHTFTSDGKLFIREDKANNLVDMSTEGDGLVCTMQSGGLAYRFNTSIHWNALELEAQNLIQQSGDVRFSGSQGHYAMFVPASHPIEFKANSNPSGVIGWTANGKALSVKLEEML